MSRLLTLDRVSFAYDRRTVMNDLSFSIDAGDYLAIIGENGSGKTTLLLGLLGLKEPSAGTITRGEALLLYRIGYLPQQIPEQRPRDYLVGAIKPPRLFILLFKRRPYGGGSGD